MALSDGGKFLRDFTAVRFFLKVKTLRDFFQKLLVPNPAGGFQICDTFAHFEFPEIFRDSGKTLRDFVFGEKRISGKHFSHRKGKTLRDFRAGERGNLANLPDLRDYVGKF